MLTCPHCCGTGQLPDISTPGEISARAAGLRAACRAADGLLTGDDKVDEATAAKLLGLARKTLGNWRSLHQPLAFTKRGGRVLYAVDTLAAWIVENEAAG